MKGAQYLRPDFAFKQIKRVFVFVFVCDCVFVRITYFTEYRRRHSWHILKTVSTDRIDHFFILRTQQFEQLRNMQTKP